MFCIKCGNSLDEGALFCPNCGTKIEEVKNTEIIKKKKKFPIIIAFALVFLVLAVIGLVFVYANSSENRLHEQLDLGYKYLSELDYEKAIAAFENVIEIDPKSVEGYKGLIEAYAGQGNPEGILQTYDTAVANLDEDASEEILAYASDSFNTLINDAVAAGDYDYAVSVTYSYAGVDSIAAEKAMNAVFYLERTHSSSNDTPENTESVADADTAQSVSETETEPEQESEPVPAIYQPTDEEVKQAFDTAVYIASDLEYWMNRYFLYDEMSLWNNDDLWTPITNFTSLAQMNSALSNYFTQRRIAEMDQYFMESNGVLYGQVGFKGGDMGAGDGYVSGITRQSETVIILTYTQEYYDFESGGSSYYVDKHFTYIYENGNWVFDDVYCLT